MFDIFAQRLSKNLQSSVCTRVFLCSWSDLQPTVFVSSNFIRHQIAHFNRNQVKGFRCLQETGGGDRMASQSYFTKVKRLL